MHNGTWRRGLEARLNGAETDKRKLLDITHPENILIVASVGLVLNLCSALLIHGART